MKRRAFSLVEVLIATTVLGLGTLGIIAILAGSATQQQTASMQNLSVGVAKNAQGLLRTMLGRPGSRFSLIREGQWTAVAMDQVTNYLTVFPGYLLAPGPVQLDPLFDAGFDAGRSLPSSPTEVLNNGNYKANSPGGVYVTNRVSELAHRRVDLESGITVTFELLRYDSITRMLSSAGTIEFIQPQTVLNSDVQALFKSSPGNFGASVQFNRREQSPVGRARIESFNIPLSAGEFINKITISPYFWRNDQLVSLNDRLITEPDTQFPGGKRPIIGYSALIRRVDSTTQLCFFTYSLRALSTPAEVDETGKRGFAFVPPDTLTDVANDEGVLREVPVQLGYDANLQRYFFEIATTDEALYGWAIDPGQILMMSSRDGVIANTPDDSGAQFPVKVLSRRTVNGKIRAMLDHSPRIKSPSGVSGRSPLTDLVTPGARQQVYVWAVQPVVASRTDQTEWRLNSIEARVIQVADQ